MNFLKNIFSGGGGQSSDHGIYFYVRPRGCEEVVRVRIDTRNDLSIKDEGEGYFVRKTIRGTYRCFNPAEMTVYFTANRTMSHHVIEKGELVEEDDYLAWEEKLAAKRAKQQQSQDE